MTAKKNIKKGDTWVPVEDSKKSRSLEVKRNKECKFLKSSCSAVSFLTTCCSFASSCLIPLSLSPQKTEENYGLNFPQRPVLVSWIVMIVQLFTSHHWRPYTLHKDTAILVQFHFHKQLFLALMFLSLIVKTWVIKEILLFCFAYLRKHLHDKEKKILKKKFEERLLINIFFLINWLLHLRYGLVFVSMAIYFPNNKFKFCIYIIQIYKI